MFLGSAEAALTKRDHANFTPARKMCHDIQGGERSAPLCTQAVFMAHFAGRREIGVKFSMRAASVDPKGTELAPLTTKKFKNIIFVSGSKPTSFA